MQMGPHWNLSGGNLRFAVDMCCIAFTQAGLKGCSQIACPHPPCHVHMSSRCWLRYSSVPMLIRLVVYIATMCTQQLTHGTSSSGQLKWLCIVFASCE